MCWASRVFAPAGPPAHALDLRLGQRVFFFVAAICLITYSSVSQQSLCFCFEGPFGIRRRFFPDPPRLSDDFSDEPLNSHCWNVAGSIYRVSCMSMT
ncbi:hypothetical protein K443DRAFT_521479 [Laccaria amethystina LaAM-08-1]|uniref:Unplaced genomic scaffold K443scaffold_58, whole genome shotgun sequence n=1 Tax=Laccaria amethystina LaAM-08-1 TaxID=1095629 RepID=A0A0C9WTP1_9AGAR|nr:hypothetical protein K443DRAFT_521479 [Laccaria amethystina LaAM-08-1]